MIQIQINPKIFNDVYIPFIENTTRQEIFYGGAGSGKSVFVAQRLIYRHLCDAGRNTLILRKVARTNRHSTFALVKRLIEQWQCSPIFKIKESTLEITNRINGNQMVFAGLDDREKLKSITFDRGDLTDVWIEEASEIGQEDFEQVNLRLRGISPIKKQITLSFNPISHLHWLKKYFFDEPKPDTAILKTTYLDNKFIDEDYKKTLQRLKDTDHAYFMIYALGEWGVIGKLIITNWRSQKIDTDPAAYDEILRGLDFGFNHPAAYVEIGIKRSEPENLYFIRDYLRTGRTNTELIADLKPLIHYARCFADSAEPDRIREFQKAGCTNLQPVSKTKGNNQVGFVKSGVDFLRSKNLICDPSCQDTINQWQLWKYKQDQDGNYIDEPVNLKDDLAAAARYAVSEKARHFAPIRSFN
jgi:phage terminase large subunit